MQRRLVWLEPDDPFPLPKNAWPAGSEAPGILAAGGALNNSTLVRAYSNAIFPWFGEDEPILWWSPDPRMVLQPKQFKLHRSLRKTIVRFNSAQQCEIRFDSQFQQVVAACAAAARTGQNGTWIGADMQLAYGNLHAAGLAHSIETWVGDTLVGGLYCVAIGKAVFGESMFCRESNSSKIALAALMGFCLHHGISMIDCQQNTRHLASMGAAEMKRADFLQKISVDIQQPAPVWQFSPTYWSHVLTPQGPA